MDVIKRMREVITSESEGLKQTLELINEDHLEAVVAIQNCKGKIVFTGVGKSGHIGQKLAATFSSLGTCAIFVHSTEAVHGDLGMIQPEDIVIMMSNSGKTQETLAMLPSLAKIGCQRVAFTANESSPLAEACEFLLTYRLEQEADKFDLAPTTSTAIMLAMGDSIGIVLSESRHFSKQDFYVYHPGGALGEKLKVEG